MTADSFQASKMAGGCSARFGNSRMTISSRFIQEFAGRWIIAAASRAAGSAQDYIDNDVKTASFNQHFINIVSSSKDGRGLQREIRQLEDTIRIDLIKQRMFSSSKDGRGLQREIRQLTDSISDLVLDPVVLKLMLRFFYARHPRVRQAGPYYDIKSCVSFQAPKMAGGCSARFGNSRITVMRMRFLIWMRQDRGEDEAFKLQRWPGAAARDSATRGWYNLRRLLNLTCL